MSATRILVVDDESDIRSTLKEVPCPGSLYNRTAPLCARMMPSTAARPASTATTTWATPASIRVWAQGGVWPKWEQGSKVT